MAPLFVDRGNVGCPRAVSHMRLKNLENRVFLALVLGTTALFLWVVRGFLMPVFWAAVFAVLFQPVFDRLTTWMRGRRAIPAFLTVVVVTLVVLIPFGLLVAAVTREGFSLYQRISRGELDLNVAREFVERSVPALTDWLARYGVDLGRLIASLESAAVDATQFIAGQALAVGQNALTLALLFGLTLYFLFFFLRDSDRIISAMIRAVPMGDVREARLLSRFAEVARATVQGTLIVAAVQGTLGGVMFAIVGIEAAVFWGVVMGMLSLLPAIGAALVWGTAAIIFIATESYVRAGVLILGGIFFVGLVDNFLRPILVGRVAKMPDYLVLLATLGGLTVFGLAGFVAGPIIAALFLVMWEMFTDEYEGMDSSTPSEGPAPSIRPTAPERPVDGERQPAGHGTSPDVRG